MKNLKTICLLINIIACLNYGLYSLFSFDVLKHIFINSDYLLHFIYFIFGISGFISLSFLQKK